MGGRGDVGQVEIRYYDVQGGDYETLLATLKKHGPRGLAEWSLAYEYQPRRAGKACSVAALTTTLKQAMTLPRWSPPQGASPQLIADWARYVAGQRKHQEGHLAIGRAMQAAFRESLAVTQVRCERLEAAIKEQYKLLLERYQARENAYDFDTAFGRTEGAEFARR
jgi:predicted secreted Zn-dependent protease